MAEGQQPFPYSAEGLGSLAYTLSDTRMSTYVKAGNRNLERAIGIYLWNARLSKAMRFPLEIAEVTVRNRINYALTDRWGRDWPRDPDFRATAAEKSIRAIEETYDLLGRGIRTADVVGGLSFGFWAAILRHRFVETLWRTRLERFFPHLPKLEFQDQLDLLGETMETARRVRNRIGHLEPIFQENPSATHSEVIRLIGFACKPTAGWARHHSTFQRVLREGPGGAVQVGPVFAKANKSPLMVAPDLTIDQLMLMLSSPDLPYVLVAGANGWHVIDTDRIGRWVSTQAAAGIVDLTEWTVAHMVNDIVCAPLVSRSASTGDLLVALGFKSGSPTRYGLVTENAKPGDSLLGVADVHAFVA